MNNIENKIIFRPTKDSIELEVKLLEDTVWLTQKQMAIVFNKDVRTINEHIKNIFKEKELNENSVIRKFRITGADSKTYSAIHYNLDMIISVGYRVNSKKGTQFRIWATKVLRDYIVKGFTLNNKKLATEAQKYKELQVQLKTLRKVYENEEINAEDAKGLIKIITDYAEGKNCLIQAIFVSRYSL